VEVSLAEMYGALPHGRVGGHRDLPVTPRQRFIYDFIVGTIWERGMPPKLREIGAALGIGSTNGVTDHLEALARHGLIVLEPCGASRDIRLPGVRWEPVPIDRPVETCLHGIALTAECAQCDVEDVG
jgi:SOS-response transcriptional repressor LexA